MADPVASLLLRLEANSAAFKSGLEQASKQLAQFERKVNAAAKNIAGAFAGKFTVDGLSALVQQGANAADAMGKLAAAAGIPIQKMSELAYAASMSGLEQDRLARGLQNLGKAMVSARDGTGDMAALFESLGVAVADASGKLRGTDEVLAGLSDAFSAMEDGAAKMTIAQQMFGQRTGPLMLQAFGAGSEALRAMGEEARKFGLVIDDQAAASAARFNDSLGKLQLQGEAFGLTLARDLTPMFESLITALSGATGETAAYQSAAEGLAIAIKGLAGFVSVLVYAVGALGTAIAGVGLAAYEAATGDLQAAKDVIDEMLKSIRGQIRTERKFLAGLFSDTQPKPPDKSLSSSVGLTAEEILAYQRAILEADKMIAAEDKRIADLAAKAAAEREQAIQRLEEMAEQATWQFGELTGAFGEGHEALLEARMAMGDLAELIERAGPAGERWAKAMLATARATDEFLQQQRALDNAMEAAEIGRQVAARRAEFERAGMSEREQSAAAMARFAGFEGALAAWEEAQYAVSGFADEVEKLRKAGDADGALAAYEKQLEFAERGAAAMEAMAAFIEEKKLAASARTFAQKVDDALANAALTIVHGLGAAGSHVAVITSGVGGILDQAMQLGEETGKGLMGGLEALMEGGDLLGAIVGIAANLLLQSESLVQVFQSLDVGLQVLVQALDPVFAGLGDVVAVIAMLLVVIGQGLAPIFQLVGDLLSAIADMIAPLVPIVAVVVDIAAQLAASLLRTLPVLTILEFAFDVVGRVLAAVGLVIVGVMWGLGKVWNGIVIAVQWVIDGIATLASYISDKVADSIRDFSRSLDRFKVDTAGAEDAMADLADMVVHGTKGRAREYAEIIKTAGGLDDLGQAARNTTEAIANMPNGFKLALHRFRALAPQGDEWLGGGFGDLIGKIPRFAEGGVVDRATLALIGEGGEREYVIPESKMPRGSTFNVQIVSNDPRRIWSELKRLMERDQLAQTGGLVPAGPRWLGGR